MSSFNHEWDEMRVKWGLTAMDLCKTSHWCCELFKKANQKQEVKTLPAESGGTENVPTVSGSWAKNGEPWTLGWVSSRICAGDRWEQEVMKHNWQDGRVSKYLSCALCYKLNKQNSRPFIKYNLKDRKDKLDTINESNKLRLKSLTDLHIIIVRFSW